MVFLLIIYRKEKQSHKKKEKHWLSWKEIGEKKNKKIFIKKKKKKIKKQQD